VLSDKVEKLKKLPVLGICGEHLAQRQSFIDSLWSHLVECGCSVSVVSCLDYHSQDYLEDLYEKALRYDAVLVACQEVPLFSHIAVREDGAILPSWAPADALSPDHALEGIRRQLEKSWLDSPLCGCVLIGGKSRRMGRPKHLIVEQGMTWVERSVALLKPLTTQVVVSGAGALPDALWNVPQIKDDAGLGGPIAGVLSVMRHKPEVSWLVMACDLPDIRTAALQWLLEQRKIGVHAVLPDMEGRGRIEPLLAYYDFRCREKLEQIVSKGSMRINRLAGQQGIVSPTPPTALKRSWRNVNSPQDLANYR